MGDRILVLVRHGESEWNKKNLFTGWRDVDLTENGIKEARTAGRRIKAQGLRFDVGFTSALVRAQHSLDLVLEEVGQQNIPVFKDQALNERDYGDLSGLNKDDARAKWGAEQVHALAALLRRRAARRREPQGHRRARAALLHPGHPAARLARRERAWSPRTAIRCARWSWCSSACRRRQIVARELATGLPLVYRLNANSTVAEKQELVG